MKKHSLALNIFAVFLTAALAIFVGGKLPYLIEKWRGPFTEGNYSAHIAQQPHKLTLYGTTTCQYCAEARIYLREAGIPFNDMLIDQSKASKEKFAQLKQNAVPILVSADRLIVGFNQKNYHKFIQMTVK